MRVAVSSSAVENKATWQSIHMKHLLKHFKTLTKHPKNAEELKGLILQLAINGTLSRKWRKQNPNVEPASVLYDKVNEERSRLIEEKAIKKTKIIPISEEDYPFDLPDKWEWHSLNDLSSINGGFAFKSRNYIEDGIRVIRISDFDENGFKDGKIVRHEYSEDLQQYQLEERNILIAMTGGTVGKSLFVERLNERMVVNQRVATIKILKPINEAYINCVIPTPLIQEVIHQAKNSTNDNISMSNIKAFKIPLPPLEEQKAIVEIVNDLFKEVEQLEEYTKSIIQLKEDFVTSALQRLTQTNNVEQEWQFLENHFTEFFTQKDCVKQLRESILQLAVQGKLTSKWRARHPELVSGSHHHACKLLERIQTEKQELIAQKKIKKEKPLPPIEDHEKPYELPDGWVWCRMQEVGLFERGKSKHRPRNDRRLFNDGKYPLVQTGDVSSSKNTGGLITTNKSYYNEFGLAQSRMWKKGTLCITIAANIAETGFLGFDACFPDSVVGFTDLLDNDDSLSKYIDCFITVTKSDLEKYAPSTAQKNINLGILYQLIFPLPPLEEQKAIVKQVNTLMALCDSLEEQIENSQTQIEQLMQSCLKEVFEEK